jgi:hypothetical protein
MPANQPHFLFARQHPSSHFLYGRSIVLILDLIDVVTSDALAGFDKTVVYEKVL